MPLPADPTDAAWLQSQDFRREAPEPARKAAKQGNVPLFAAALREALHSRFKLGKRQRCRVMEQLQIFRAAGCETATGSEAASLSHCLFESGTDTEELSGRIETIMAAIPAAQAAQADPHTLRAAQWLLVLFPQRIELQTLFSLWRWTREGCLAAQQTTLPPAEEGEDGDCTNLDLLELLLLQRWVDGSLRTAPSSGSSLKKQLAQVLESATDEDGTPHSRWLPELFPRLAQLARLQIAADLFRQPLWNRKSLKRIEALWNHGWRLWSPELVFCSTLSPGQTMALLREIATVFSIKVPAPIKRFLRLNPAAKPDQPIAVNQAAWRKQFGKENHQSDWAEWGVLRSAWSMPDDRCLIRHAGRIPTLDVLCQGVPFLQGNWSHTLELDGQAVPTEGEWTCCCWYQDRQAAYLELQLTDSSPAQVMRQILLLREESVLILGDAVRLPESHRIHFRRTNPLAENWQLEQDTATRELALFSDVSRVRVFPWTSPQFRQEPSQESTQVQAGQLILDVQTQGSAFYASTLLDWSKKRRDAGVDWQRLTVAEDGQSLPPHVAAAHRLRLGKKQWVTFHNLTRPPIPRTALGIHSASETVIAELGSNGDARTLTEVEL
jgi:hypothetical protein